MQRARHPALHHLDALVGEWETEATHPYLPNTVIRGRATFEWLVGGQFLIWRARHDHPDIPESIASLGCGGSGDTDASSDSDGDCWMHSFDSRVYRISADEGGWRFWRDRPGLSQRYICTIGADGNAMLGNGELSRDGSTWDQDLRITLAAWGSPPAVFPREVRAAYAAALRDPAHAHALCEEYRAAATLDREHDRADHAAGRRIGCPVLLLWSAGGPLGTWYEEKGGPIALWRAWCADVHGHPLSAGHFFPEEVPQQTAEMLSRFFGPAAGGRTGGQGGV